uniref:DUF7041 domain-containing protein n=1 Tax=Cacopsylla melanoneura TaxID=428564 RepID=A0A8D8SD97_9HEMI
MPDGQSGDPDVPTNVINRITLKLPPFCKRNPKLWFLQLESNFHTASITRDDTKFHHVIASVETDVLELVTDTIEAPPADNKYEALKSRILKVFELNHHQRQQKLLTECVLGDKKPSHLLLEMQKLAGQDFSDEMIKSLWLSRLPPSTQSVLVASTETLSKISSIADAICSLPCQSVNSLASDTSAPEIMNEMKQTIDLLTQEVNQIKYQRRPARPFFKNRNNNPLCYYHQKFGPRAHKCEKPCSFNSSKNL